AATPDATRLDLACVPVSWARSLLARAWPQAQPGAGVADGTIQVHAPVRRPLRVEGTLEVGGLALETTDAAVAMAGLDGRVAFEGVLPDAAGMRLAANGVVHDGQILVGNTYVALSGVPFPRRRRPEPHTAAATPPRRPGPRRRPGLRRPGTGAAGTQTQLPADLGRQILDPDPGHRPSPPMSRVPGSLRHRPTPGPGGRWPAGQTPGGGGGGGGGTTGAGTTFPPAGGGGGGGGAGGGGAGGGGVITGGGAGGGGVITGGGATMPGSRSSAHDVGAGPTGCGGPAAACMAAITRRSERFRLPCDSEASSPTTGLTNHRT